MFQPFSRSSHETFALIMGRPHFGKKPRVRGTFRHWVGYVLALLPNLSRPPACTHLFLTYCDCRVLWRRLAVLQIYSLDTT